MTAQPQDLAFPDEPFRANQPAAAAVRPFTLPEVHRFELAIGIQVYLDEQHHLPLTFALCAATLRSPGLRQSELERMLKRRIEAVKQARGNPTAIPGRVSSAVLYGPAHPFGTVITEQTLAAITLADCRQQLATWMQPRGARLFVVGDLTEAQIRDLFAQSALADWEGTPPQLPEPPPPATMAGRIFFVHVAGTPQATVMLMEHGPLRTAPDYFANTMMAGVFAK